MGLARNAACLLVALTALRAAGAQVQAGENTARKFRIPAAVIAPGQYVYQTTLEQNAGTSVLGTRTISVSQTGYGGGPAWLLLETRSGDGIPAADSLFAGIVDLHPIHWSSTLGGARLAAEFRGDTVYGGTTAPAGRRTMVTVVPSGTLITSAMLETVLRLLPLQTGWEDSTTTLSISLNGNSVVPTRMSVIGEDRVRVPAGTYDCWVVAVHADAARGMYWVTKTDPIVVRSVLDVPAMGGAQLVSALTRVSR